MNNQTEVRWRRLWAMVPVAAITFMDQSILPVALPAIEGEFQAQPTALQWAVNSYLLATALFILVGGKLGDRAGHRVTYLWGIATFIISSLMCALSPNIGFLIASRFVQGIGAALMIPAQSSLLAATFPPHARGRATGMIVSVGSLFAVIGPAVGGYLTEYFSWRFVFWINFPIGILGIALAWALLPSLPRGKGKIDLLGFGHFAICSTAVTIFFMQGQDWGWRSAKTLWILAAALIFGYFLIKREKQAAHPFLDLSLFKRLVFAAINLNISIAQFVMMIAVFRTVYIEEILGYTPTQTGLISSCSALPVLLFSPLAGLLSDKISPKLPIAMGFTFIFSSLLWLAIHPTPTLATLFSSLLLFGAGIPMIFTPSYAQGMLSVPVEKIGVAAGMIATLRMTSGTIGLSLIYLFVDLEQTLHLDTLGSRGAEINSFSRVHFALAVLVAACFAASFWIYRSHKRISS